VVDVSVVIPTNRERDVLDRCLAALADQTFAARRIEVFVIFNGASPVDWPGAAWPFPLVVDHLEQPNIAAAKNLAIERARGEWILLLNDDVVVEPDFIDAHVSTHRRLGRPALVLGESAWPRYADATLFDEMIARTPMVFFYPRMRPRQWYDFRHAWNLNLSLRREHLAGERFDERLGPFFYEDVELAYRLERGAGLRVWYEPGARLTHEHRYTFDGYLAREAAMGRAALRLGRANPACFAALYGAPLDARFVQYCERYVRSEGRYESEHIANLRAVVEQRRTELAVEDPGIARWLEVLYQAHLPLKRIAFRRALLEAFRGAAASRVSSAPAATVSAAVGVDASAVAFRPSC
jgi:GT2 family glycosyltransferase